MKEIILSILQQHQGRNNPITGRELANLLNQNDDRKIRLLIEELIDDGYPIVGATQSPCGYFIAVNIQEVKECTESLKSRAVQIFTRRQKLLRNMLKIQKEKQGVLL
jgi:hypothetical protein